MQSNYANVEKAQKKFDSEIATWKSKVEDLQNELENSQKECRNYTTELFRYSNSVPHLDNVIRLNEDRTVEIGWSKTKASFLKKVWSPVLSH